MNKKLPIPINTLMCNYREAACQLWNCSFLPLFDSSINRPDLEKENEWDFRDRYEDICVDLFCSLVLWPLGIHEFRPLPAYRGEKSHLPCIIVSPILNAEMRIGLSDNNNFSGYDHTIDQETKASLDLRFQDFFDFYVLGNREYEWIHAIVVNSPRRTDLIGRSVLIKRSYAEFQFFQS